MSRGHAVDILTSGPTSVATYGGAAVVGLIDGIDIWLKIAALIGAILLAFVHMYKIKNERLTNQKLILELKKMGTDDV